MYVLYVVYLFLFVNYFIVCNKLYYYITIMYYF